MLKWLPVPPDQHLKLTLNLILTHWFFNPVFWAFATTPSSNVLMAHHGGAHYRGKRDTEKNGAVVSFTAKTKNLIVDLMQKKNVFQPLYYIGMDCVETASDCCCFEVHSKEI